MRKILSGSGLKIIAMVTMFIDHLAIVLSKCGLAGAGYYAMRGVGRLSFPIYCFVLVQGFVNTRSVPKYIGRIAALALLSEIPYNMTVFGTFLNPAYNNILFTFTLALAMLWALSKFEHMGVKGYFFSVSLIAVTALAAYVLRLDYSWRCILLVAALYLTRYGYDVIKYALGTVILWINTSIIGLAAPLSFVPIHLYNGEKGKVPKYLFYAFFPAHLLVLGLIRMYIIKQ